MQLMEDPAMKTKILDTNARYLGVSVEQLMINAGKGVAGELLKKYKKNRTYSFLCGLGNNGGDGLVAALEIAKKGAKKIQVYLNGDPKNIKTGEAKKQWEKLIKSEFTQIDIITSVKPEEIKKSDIFVECLVGTGIKGNLSKKAKNLISKMNKKSRKIVAVDLPLPGYKPDLVLSLAYPKTEKTITIDIGIPKEAGTFCGPGEVKALSEPKPNVFKYDNGELLVFGGSNKFHGAPLMSIKAAGKIAGSVFYYTTYDNRETIGNLKNEIPEFIVSSDNNLEKYATYANAFLLGPGLEENLPTKAIIAELLENYPETPTVLDAYAIAIAKKEKKGLLKNKIITPHRQELRHIFNGNTPKTKKATEKALQEFAIGNECYIILTGKIDVLFNKNGEIAYNKTGNQGMSKGGTGDILAGILTGFLTKNDPWLSMRAATFVCGKAGDNLYEKFGYNYSATDLIPEIQRVIKWCKDF